MKTLTVEEAKNQFDVMFSTANHEPIEIMQDGLRVGVFLPDADAELIEDMLLAQKVIAAKQQGTIGVDASRKFLDRLRNAKD
jgi:hypothetical protein